MTVSTGCRVLDQALDGGLPENRTTLVTGGPGTGKSTLGMQFLDAALERGERCLFVSTEQAPDDVRQAFSGFTFDMDHENLDIVSIHPTRGETLEGEETLVLSDFESEDELEGPFDGFDVPYRQRYVERFLERYEECDCIVFDSASALLDLPGGREAARRTALDLTSFLQQELAATTLLTGEGGDVDPGVQRALEYAAHGVIKLDTRSEDGEASRTLRIVKMRGSDHDRREYTVNIDESGFHILPEHRTPTHRTGYIDTVSTGIAGLDGITGGIPTGGASMVEHDGDADVEQFALAALAQALRDGRRVILAPPRFLTREAVDESLPDDIPDVATLLDEDQLFVVDPLGVWDHDHNNIIPFGSDGGLFSILTGRTSPRTTYRLYKLISQLSDQLEEASTLTLIFLEGFLQQTSPRIIQRVSNWALANEVGEDQTWWVFLNPGVTDSETVEFFRHDTRQRLRTWLGNDGVQRIRLEKGAGQLKRDHVVSWTEEPPYVRIEQPY